MAIRRHGVGTKRSVMEVYGGAAASHASLDADIIIANAPDPVFVSDLEGKILQANGRQGPTAAATPQARWSNHFARGVPAHRIQLL